MTDLIAPLLSSVSVMLAAFGFLYSTQKDRIDDAAADTDIPDDQIAKTNKYKSVKKARNLVRLFACAALSVWILLLPQIVAEADEAFDQNFDMDAYSTPQTVFFVAANAWLVVSLFLASRAKAVNARVQKLL